MRAAKVVVLSAAAVALACGSGSPASSPTVAITSPTGPVFTSGADVLFQIASDAKAVEVVRDGAVQAILTEKPFEYTWSPAGAPEGASAWTARVVNGSAVSAPVLVTVDRTPPRLDAQSPAMLANGDVRAPLRLAFDEPVLASAASPRAFSVHSAALGELAATASLQQGGTVLEIATSPRLAAPDTVTVSLSDAIRDRAGNALAPVTLSVEIPTWFQPSRDVLRPDQAWAYYRLTLASQDDGEVVLSPGYLPDTVVALAPGGTWRGLATPSFGFVATGGGRTWLIDDLEFMPALFERQGDGFTPRGRFPDVEPGADTASSPRLFVDGQGNPIVSICRGFSGQSGLRCWVGRFTGGQWDVTPPLPAVAEPFVLVPAAAPSADGALFLTYAESATVRVARWSAGALEALPGSPSDIWPNDFELALAPDGHLFGVVETGSFSAAALTVREWDVASSSWRALGAPLPGATAWQRAPALVATPGGSLVVAYVDGPYEAGGRVLAASWDGSAWTPLGDAVSAPGVHADAPALAVDPAGTPLCGWFEATGAIDQYNRPLLLPRFARLNR